MGKLFPYLNADAYVQACYVENLLEIVTYVPSLREKILHLIVHKTLQLDVRTNPLAGLHDRDTCLK